jgi:hydroxymethylpyrimidine kinase/phosphomethylpyrimidine kinase/thiamine-phosphate diphosphorylase
MRDEGTPFPRVQPGAGPVVLTIAGSDPSGGAGIQRDLRTFAALGVDGVSVITAVTAQNTRGVHGLYTIPARHLAAQLDAVLSDIPVAAVKIGMLGGPAQVVAVADALRRYRPPNVVLDPVLAATGGEPLLSPAGREALLARLIPLCDLVTPNLAEVQALLGAAVARAIDAAEAAAPLLARGAGAVLVKGGHLSGAPVDVLIQSSIEPVFFIGERVQTPHTHGTGCLLSSAIAAFLARGASLEAAVGDAKSAVTEALKSPVILGQGRGFPEVRRTSPPGPFPEAGRGSAGQSADFHLPSPLRGGGGGPSQPLGPLAFPGLKPGAVGTLVRGLYVLTDTELRPERSAEEIVKAALAGGARIVQLRDKRHSTAVLVPLAKRLRERAHATGALFIVNDRVDVAVAADADGVHLGPDDMDPRDARRLLGPDRILGVSVSTVAEAAPVAAVASYLGVGAIFGSATKSDAGPPVGVERIREIRRAFPKHPIVAIGGIQRENIGDVIAAGADAAAVVSAVVAAPDMERATRELVQRIGAALSKT